VLRERDVSASLHLRLLGYSGAWILHEVQPMPDRPFEAKPLTVAPVKTSRRAVTPAAGAVAASLKSDLHPLWIALLLLTVLTISRVHQYFSVIGRLRPALLLFTFAMAYAVIRWRVLTRSNLLRWWPGKVIIALGVLACLSALFGISLGGSARFILDTYSKTLIYACTLILAVRSWLDVRRLVWAYVIGAGVLVWLSLFVVGISKTTAGLTYDANDTGLVLLVAVPLTLLVFQSSGWFGKMVSAPILLGVVVTIAKSSSRGAFVGLLLVGVAILVSLHGVSMVKRAVIVAVAAGVLIVGAPAGYWDLVRTLQEPTEDYNWSSEGGRKEIAKRGIGYMLGHPLFGIGVANFPRAEGTISEIAQTAAPDVGIRWAAAHNSYVQVGAEMGIPGVILWSSLVFGGIVGVNRLRRRVPKTWRRGGDEERFLFWAAVYVPIAMIGFAVTAFFVSFAYMDPIYVLSAMVAGLYLTIGRRLGAYAVQAAAPAHRPGRHSRGAACLVVAPVPLRSPRTER
jgi:hypothetical protein